MGGIGWENGKKEGREEGDRFAMCISRQSRVTKAGEVVLRNNYASCQEGCSYRQAPSEFCECGSV
jgi:hypothetical protein